MTRNEKPGIESKSPLSLKSALKLEMHENPLAILFHSSVDNFVIKL
jgi:hypothetical protein